MGAGWPRSSISALARILSTLCLSTCGPPDGPTVPDEVALAPPAAFDCVPPYARFANRTFTWLDMDRGISCDVFFEQDECVLGVFRDCTTDEPREWRGSIDEASEIRLVALFADSTHAASARRPVCCGGSLVRSSSAPSFSRLACQLEACDNPNDQSHVGLYLEEPAAPSPAGRRTSTSVLPGPIVDLEEGFALVVSAPPGQSGVYRVDGPEPVLVQGVEGGRALAVAGASEAWILLDETLVSPEGSQLDLGPGAVAIAADRVRALVLFEDRIAAFSRAGPSGDAELALGRGVDLIASTGAFFALVEAPLALVEIGPDLTQTTFALEDQPASQPRGLAWLDGLWGFVGRCHPSASKDHCLYLVDRSSPVPDRLGLPNGRRLGRPLAGPGDTVWVPDEAGFVHVVSATQRRPLLRERFSVVENVAQLTETSTGRFRAMAVGQTDLWTVESTRAFRD